MQRNLQASRIPRLVAVGLAVLFIGIAIAHSAEQRSQMSTRGTASSARLGTKGLDGAHVALTQKWLRALARQGNSDALLATMILNAVGNIPSSDNARLLAAQYEPASKSFGPSRHVD